MRLLAALVLLAERAAGERPRRRRYGLLLAGGLRTFLVTWPSTRAYLVDANGGRPNWYVALAASFGRGQAEVAAATRDLCARERFEWCGLFPHDAGRTRAFYAGERRALAQIERCGGRKVCSFAFQWELVSRAFEALLSSGVSADLDFVVRARPDTVLFRPLDVAAYAAAACPDLPPEACAAIPCAVFDGRAVAWRGGADGERLVDDFLVASVDRCRDYARRWNGADVAEGYVTRRMGTATATRVAHHAVLAYGNARTFVDSGRYRTTRNHARCVGAIDDAPTPGRRMAAYNASDDGVLARYVDDRRRRAAAAQ